MELKADLPSVAAALAATLVAVDGKIKKSEYLVAMKLGEKTIPGFRPLLFDILLYEIENIPPAGELAGLVNEMLTDDDKTAVMQYLAAIAIADNELLEVEWNELEAVGKALGTKVPLLKEQVVG